ncbi:MAG: bifunctional 5,10-methylenetetrahydrofolate dehydrogenase/5,10-methenyltetrahydrofolate cyclohydrolase [Candidatus Omnitrophota bacterium]
MAKIIDGRDIARESNNKVKKEIQALCLGVGRPPKLVSLLVGTSEDAELYVKMQKRAAEFTGIDFDARYFNKNISEKELICKIEEMNLDNNITAIIAQKPLPKGIDYDKISSAIIPKKDAEGVHPYNLGSILRQQADIVPCTAGAVMKILAVHNVKLYGKEVVIVGHSAIVGKPLSLMMLNETATTTVCHIATSEKGALAEHVKRAEVLVVAVGKAEMIKGEWIKQGAVVIDVGINKMNGKIVGDVKFDEVCKRASIVSPVPGGVGPVTVSILMRNVLRAYRNQNVKT